ncbi:MAG: tRNA (guanosine(46)-N7)-methyltransferase TrmB, partial [Stenotrophobium sp.]
MSEADPSPVSRLPSHALRRVRSFVRREGRMTDGQKSALERLWPRYGLDAPPPSPSPASGGG